MIAGVSNHILKGAKKTSKCAVTELPNDEVGFIMAMQEMSMHGGQTAVCARFMKEFYIPLTKVLDEETQKDCGNSVVGLLSFFVNISAYSIRTTSKDTDTGCDIYKRLFSQCMDDLAPVLHKVRKKGLNNPGPE